MIIRYYKGYVSNEQLREMSKTDKRGTNAYYMVKTLNKLGFEAIGLKLKLEEIKKFPAIAHVTIDGTYQHYVVIYRMNKKNQTVIIADPAKKIMKMSIDEFNKIYNDVVIEIDKIKKIPIIKNYSITNFLISTLKPLKKTIVKISIQSLLITILAIASSFYLKVLLSSNDIKMLFYIFLIIAVVRLMLDYIKNKSLIELNYDIDKKVTLDTYKSILALPYYYFKNHTTGEIITRLNDLESVKSTLSKTIITIFVDALFALISGIFLFKINRFLFLIIIFILLIYIIITVTFHRYFKNRLEDLKDEKEQINQKMIESIEGIETIKGLNLENHFINETGNSYKDYMKDTKHLDKAINLEYLFKDTINTIGNMILILFGILFIKNNTLELATLITFTTIATYFLEPIKNIINLNLEIIITMSSLRRMLELGGIQNKDGDIKIEEVDDITIKSLNYSHDLNQVLKNVDLNVKKGEKIMMVGPSGGGKSSLLKLIKKYGQVNDNTIFINGIDINKIKEVPIFYISQNEILFTDTLKNNLTLNNLQEEEKIKEVYHSYLIDKILPLNYIIEENGFNISGGEKQRIILGRTILKSPQFLIIDEALNEVDVSMERKLLKEIMKIKNITLIYVSHRNSNMDLFTRVIKLENGSIKEDLKKCESIIS